MHELFMAPSDQMLVEYLSPSTLFRMNIELPHGQSLTLILHTRLLRSLLSQDFFPLSRIELCTSFPVYLATHPRFLSGAYGPLMN